jgi:HlyD family secretion protein
MIVETIAAMPETKLPQDKDKAQSRLDVRVSLRRLILAGVISVLVLVGGFGGWAVATRISGAVIAQGKLIVESSVKKVQHPIGGVVGELKVREGEHVQSGDVLLRLDQTQALANLDIVKQTLDELTARRARDEAERDDLQSIRFPDDLLAQIGDPRVARLIGEEKTLFENRKQGRDGQKAQLGEQVSQLGEQANGLNAQLVAKDSEIHWNDEELRGVQDLWQRHLVQFVRLTALQRDAARLGGERGQLVSQLAEVRYKKAETALKIIQIDSDMRTEVAKEIGEIRAKTSELEEKRVAAEDQLKRIELKAPLDGFVHQLSVHTVGGVITAGETVMTIVPDDDALTVEARIQPNDIEQIHMAQPAVVRFTSFDQRTTPDLNGQVSLISADLDQDDKTGTSFYTLRIAIPPDQIARLETTKLVPGMPVEAFIQTKPRTVMSYLVQPMRDQIERAFRER